MCDSGWTAWPMTFKFRCTSFYDGIIGIQFN